MRKFLFGAVLVLVLLLTGCDSKEQVKQETTEIFHGVTISPSGALVFDGYTYLHFYSSETDGWVYLCNRPGCLHSDGSCGAFWGPNFAHAFFYNGSLYVLQAAGGAQGGRLIRANRYGEERQEIGTLESFPYQSTFMQIVGSDLYCITDIWSDDESGTERALCRINLENGDCDRIPQPDTGYLAESFLDYAVTDDYLYYLYLASDIDINDFFDQDTGEFTDASWKDINYATQLYRMNRKTEEFELLLERTTVGNISHTIDLLQIEDEKLLLVLEDQVVEYDPDTGETTFLLDMTTVVSDDWLNMKQVGEMWIVNMTNGQLVLLKDWKEVARFSGPGEAYYQALGMCDETVYFVGNGLCYINYENLVNGDYTIRVVDDYPVRSIN